MNERFLQHVRDRVKSFPIEQNPRQTPPGSREHDQPKPRERGTIMTPDLGGNPFAGMGEQVTQEPRPEPQQKPYNYGGPVTEEQDAAITGRVNESQARTTELQQMLDGLDDEQATQLVDEMVPRHVRNNQQMQSSDQRELLEMMARRGQNSSILAGGHR